MVAATWMEVRLLEDELDFVGEARNNLKKYTYKNLEIEILISGIGTTFTTFHLTNALLGQKYDKVINTGIAGGADEFPFENGVIKNQVNGLPSEIFPARGITTNKTNGRESSINELNAKFNAQIESMEGAAVFYVCKWMGIPFREIRAVSNFVEPRDKSAWNIPLALENLKSALLSILENDLV